MAARLARALLQVTAGTADEFGATINNAHAPATNLAPASQEGNVSFWASDAAGLAVCGIFAWLAALISCYQIYLHATNYEDPIIQKYYIRIIILIPNYAICSFFSLAFPGASVYIETARDMYEAFVIYSFISLLLEFIGGPGNVEAYCRDRTIKGSLLYGTCCFPTMQVDGQFVKLCKRLVLQFVIVKPALVICTIVLYSQGRYTEGDWSAGSSYLYIQIVYNLTYGCALLALIHFWAGTRNLLKPYKPVWKFLTVKGVVFITFWQGLIVSLLFIDAQNGNYKAKQLQTWLLCIEMLPAAVAMWFAFPASQYMNAQRNAEQGGIMMAVQNVGNVVMFTDVVTDLKHQFRPQYNTYTCYKDVDQDTEGSGNPTPSGQYRHATYIIRDPFQEQEIAQSRSRNGQVAASQSAAPSAQANGKAGPSRPAAGDAIAQPSNGVPVANLFGEMQDVPLGDGPSGPRPGQGPANPFHTDL